MSDPTFEYIPIETLVPDPNNYRIHTPRNLKIIGDSIQEDGFARPIFIDEKNEILNGNGTVEAAMERGIGRVLLVETEGDVVVAHRRKNMTEDQKVRIRIRDNKASDTSVFDNAALGLLQLDRPDLLTGIFEKYETDAFLIAAGKEAGRAGLRDDVGPKDDLAAELMEQWGTATGQIWVIPSLTVPGGCHRLAIGDCTEESVLDELFPPQDLARCIWTDPPYGVDYAAKNKFLNKALKLNAGGELVATQGNRVEQDIEGDLLTPDAVETLIRGALTALDPHTMAGAGVYLTGPQGPMIAVFVQAFQASPFGFHQGLVWIKNHFVIGMGDYQYKHEFIYYGWKRDGKHYWDGTRTLDSVIEVDKPQRSKLHPTTKPVELIQALIEHSSRPGEIIADPFLGSGSTIIACELLDRLCYGVEKNPSQGAVVLQRCTDLGLSPRLEAPL